MKSGNPLLKYMMKNEAKSEVFHSSGYARAQNGGNMGATTAESFSQRQSIEERRKFIQGFRNARIAQSRNLSLRAKSLEAMKTEIGARSDQPATNSRGGTLGGRGGGLGGRGGLR